VPAAPTLAEANGLAGRIGSEAGFSALPFWFQHVGWRKPRPGIQRCAVGKRAALFLTAEIEPSCRRLLRRRSGGDGWRKSEGSAAIPPGGCCVDLRLGSGHWSHGPLVLPALLGSRRSFSPWRAAPGDGAASRFLPDESRNGPLSCSVAFALQKAAGTPADTIWRSGIAAAVPPPPGKPMRSSQRGILEARCLD